MTRVDGHVEFGGYTIHLEASVHPDPYGYDAAAAKYGSIPYGSASGAPNWQVIDCQVIRVSANYGGRIDEIPGMRAELGRLTAELYDPLRILDPTVSPFALLTRVGVPVRLTATSPGGTVTVLWAGVADTWTHNLKDGTGQLTASDNLALIAGTDLGSWVRPAETALARLQAAVAMMPVPMTLVYSGTGTSLSGSSYSGSLWSMVQDVGEVEQSIVWVDPLARLRRADITGFGTAVKATDCDDGVTPIIYYELTSVTDDEVMRNVVTVERLNLTEAEKQRPPLTYLDTESANENGAHTLKKLDLALPDDAALGVWANKVLALRDDSVFSISGLSVTITDVFPWTPRTVPAVIGLGIASVLDVHLTSRGKPGNWAVGVAGIAHTITPDEWVVDLEVIDGAKIALNKGYDDPTSIYDTTKYSGPIGVRPALADLEVAS